MLRNLFRSSVAFACVALALKSASAQGLEFNPYEPSLTPIASATAPAVHWETNFLDAYVNSLEQNLPLVVLFTEPGDSPDREAVEEASHSRLALESDVLVPYADRAIFATCELKEFGTAGSDEFGVRVAWRLGITISPTLAVLAPNFYDLTCTFSSIGTNGETLRKDLNAILIRAVSPEATWNPPSPAFAVDQLADAMKRGELHRVRASFAYSFSEPMRAQVNLGTEISNAKLRLQETIAAVFGTPVEAFDEIGDAERLKTALRRFIDHEVVEVTTSDDVTQVRVHWTVRDGNSVEDSYETFQVVHENNGYRLISSTLSDDTAGVEAWVRQNQNVPALLEQVRVDVERGRYGTAAEAREAALRSALSDETAAVGMNSSGATP
jgi:hypothetical protein